ncbi:helix-turn-helix transcriptional regulator [Mucilaginibacter sp. HD30]
MSEVKKSALDQHIIGVVKQLRVKNGLSQAALAVKLDVTDSFIGAIENPLHRAKYNIDHLNKLAKIFNCSPKDFFPDNPL